MDRHRYTLIGHTDMPLWHPCDPDALFGMLAAMNLAPHHSALDIGCGRGEILLALAETAGVRGLGVDESALALALARAQSAARDPRGLVRWHCGAFADEILAGARFDAVVCIGASHALGAPKDALPALARLVRPGGYALLGELFWQRPPAREFLASLGMEADALSSFEGIADQARAAGFEVAGARACTVDDWDRYESAHAANIERFTAAHPDDPDAPAMRARARSWAAMYRAHGRASLGFGHFLLRRPADQARSHARSAKG